MIDKELLRRAGAAVSAEVDARLAERLDLYAARLLEWNRKMNLTAITDPADLVVKHFADSLSAAPALPTSPFSLIDVGTGAGFPGVPLALLREDCTLTLLDSLQKRLTFLEAVCGELGLRATFVHARAEEGARRQTARGDRADPAAGRGRGARGATAGFDRQMRAGSDKIPPPGRKTGKIAAVNLFPDGGKRHLNTAIYDTLKDAEAGASGSFLLAFLQRRITAVHPEPEKKG